MPFGYRIEVEISQEFRELLKRQKYEEIVFPSLNRSKKMIGGLPLKRVLDQSHGEADYVNDSGEKYDIKLLLDKEQGELIGEEKNDLKDWLKSMLEEIEEYSISIEQRDLSLVKNTKLYLVMKKRLKSIREDETAILFIPFPVGYDNSKDVFLQFTTDFLQATYNALKDELHCKGVLFLYPSMDAGVYVLRNADTMVREYIESPEIENYISYRFVI